MFVSLGKHTNKQRLATHIKRSKKQRRGSFGDLPSSCSGDIEHRAFIIVFTRDRAPKSAQSCGLAPPSFMCARYYVLAFVVLGRVLIPVGPPAATCDLNRPREV